MLDLDKNGGIIPDTKAKMQRAKAVDLVTFPLSVNASNCGNCASFHKIKDLKAGYGYCSHPEVDQYVAVVQCCNEWNKPGIFRAFK